MTYPQRQIDFTAESAGSITLMDPMARGTKTVAAMGRVTIPEGYAASLKLEVSPSLELIDSLAPDSIQALFLLSPKLTDSHVEMVISLPGLKALDIVDGRSLSDIAAMALSKLQRLRSLTIHRSKMTDQGLAHLCTLENLEALSISLARLTDRGLSNLAKLRQLRILSLQGNRSIFGETLTALKGSRLEVLWLAGTQVQDEALAALSSVTSLRMIELPASVSEGVFSLPANVQVLLPRSFPEDLKEEIRGRRPDLLIDSIRESSKPAEDPIDVPWRRPTLVVVEGADCPPCDRLKEQLRLLPSETLGKIDFVHLDLERDRKQTELLKVLSVPTSILFVGGIERLRMIGAHSAGTIAERIERVVT